MHSYFILKTFKHWLKENRGCFIYQPYIIHISKNTFNIRFQGVDPRIDCVIKKEGSTAIYVNLAGTCWDILAEFDVISVRTMDGRYYCELCEAPQFYASRQEPRTLYQTFLGGYAGVGEFHFHRNKMGLPILNNICKLSLQCKLCLHVSKPAPILVRQSYLDLSCKLCLHYQVFGFLPNTH